MLPKPHRILVRKDFLICYSEGKKFFTKNYIVFVRKTDLVVWRLGITATKKNGNAVMRNRFKRVVRAFYEKYMQKICAGHDYIILSRHPLNHTFLSLPSLEQELFPLLKKLGHIGVS